MDLSGERDRSDLFTDCAINAGIKYSSPSFSLANHRSCSVLCSFYSAIQLITAMVEEYYLNESAVISRSVRCCSSSADTSAVGHMTRGRAHTCLECLIFSSIACA